MFYIIACTPHFKKCVLDELRKIDSEVKAVKQFDPEIFMIETTLSKENFTKSLLKLDPIFIKHIAPVDKIISTYQTKENLIGNLPNEAEEIVKIETGTEFAIQARVIGKEKVGLDYKSKDIEVALGEYFCNEDTRGVPVFSDNNLIQNGNVYIVSVCVTPEKTYLGFSQAKENLNFHNNEYRVISRNGKIEVSRAENKLKEAIAKFSLKLEGGKALDVGAAPGGWTKVLLDNGYDVVAVDPGKLDDSLENNPRVDHKACKIQELEFENYFDIIVNDMNMKPLQTSQVMCNLHKCLKDGAKCVLTVKLFCNAWKGIKLARETLEPKFEILKIKNLFHNRQEVTMLLKKK